MDKALHLYEYDFCTLKSYNGFKHKLTLHRSYRMPGFEIEQEKGIRGQVNDEKLENNISRTKARVLELALCNNWELFVTLTLNGKKHNRSELAQFRKELTQWLRNYNRLNGTKIKYLLIPELHKDKKSWHMHGFIMGLPLEHLTINKHGYLDWLPYQQKFGWISLDKVRSHEGAALYITKYISKDLSECVKQLNDKMFYCSQGLNEARIIKSGTLVKSVPQEPNYENEYVKVYWIKEHEQIASVSMCIK